jgi:NAD(P)-dependent dehydrogenase (short-subunit alcohol dehydrogenase family)
MTMKLAPDPGVTDIPSGVSDIASGVSHTEMASVAVVTGGSHGLGRALAGALADRGWSVVIDGRRFADLDRAVAEIGSPRVTAVAGDVADPAHRDTLVATATALGPVSLLVNNASQLGPSPQPRLRHYPADALRDLYDVNVFAPLELIQLLLPALTRTNGIAINVSSDAAVEAYEGWGGYGSSKAALDHASRVIALEEPAVRVYAVDPGDMRTEMHQLAFPGEDISDRPDADSVVPALLRLLADRPASGRYRAADLMAAIGPHAVSSGAAS